MEPTRKHVGGFEYICAPFMAKRALGILTRLTKLLGTSFAQMAKGGGDATAVLADAVRDLTDRLSEAEVSGLIDDLLSQVQVIMPDGKRPYVKDVFDPHFQGRLSALFGVVFFVLETNFSDFFTSVRNMPQVAEAVHKFQSPT